MLALAVPLCVHKVSEGHIALYFRGGALLKETAGAGYNIKIPYLTTYEEVQVTIQTDAVRNIPCGTRGGVMISFDRVEVVNRLDKKHAVETVRKFGLHYDKPMVFDKIHHEINQFCSRHTLQEVFIDLFDTIDESLKEILQNEASKYETGIDIIAVRVTKPRIPENIRKNYEEMEAQRTQLLIAAEHQKVAEREATTEKRRAVIEAEKVAEVMRVRKQQEITEKETSRRISELNDAIFVAQEKAKADARAYKLRLQAAANKKLLTPAYLEMQRLSSLANASKVYFGTHLDTMHAKR